MAAWVGGVPYLASLGRSDFSFEDLPDLPPFRRLRGDGPATLAGAALVGIDTGAAEPATDPALLREVRDDPCAALFGETGAGPVPVAVFSDFACPICRVMEERLADLEASDPGSFRIQRHQLPLLGAASTTASRAVLAADLQGGYREMHARLMRTPAVTDAGFVAAIARDIGLDPRRLRADMSDPAIDRRLRVSAAIAEVFGFFGTPAFAVGRTVFMGSIETGSLRRLIALETPRPCAVSAA